MVRSYFKKLLAVIFLFSLSIKISAQIRTDEEPRRLYYQRTFRVKKFNEMKSMRDVLHLNKFGMGKRRLSGNISYQFGRLLMDRNGVKSIQFRSTMAYFIRYRFFEEFSLNLTFLREYNPMANADWIGDFAFSIGRYNWRKRKLNYGYENFGNQKYTDNFSQFLKKILQGYAYLSYNFSSARINKAIRIDKTTVLHAVSFIRYSVYYQDNTDQLLGGLFNGKPTAGFSLRFVIVKNIYAESAVYAYLPGKKQPWDPDFTYGFGYFDWRPFHLSFTYGNWAINRFPWNDSRYSGYGFLDGTFRLTFNWVW